MATDYSKRKTIVTKENIARIPKKNFDLWEEFRRDMTLSKGKDAEKTLRTYKSAVLAFMIWLVDNYGDKSFLEIDHKIVKKYLYYCQEELGNNGKIRNLKTSSISSLLNFCVREEYIEYNPLDKKIKRADISNEQIIDQPFLNEEQVIELRDKIDEIENYEKRMLYALIHELAFSTAARVGALAQFSETNLDLNNRLFKSIREKRGKILDLGFSVRGQSLLREWIEYKKNNGIDTPAIFCVKYDGKWDFMSISNFQAIVKNLGELIGVNMHMHSYRKSYSNVMKSKGVEIQKIQEKLNHESSDTTIKFYTKKDVQETQKELDKYEI